MFTNALFNIYKTANNSFLMGFLYVIAAYLCYALASNAIMLSHRQIVTAIATVPFMLAFIFLIQTTTLLVATACFKTPTLLAEARHDMQKETNILWQETVSGNDSRAIEQMLSDYSEKTGIDYMKVSRQAEEIIDKKVTSYAMR